MAVRAAVPFLVAMMLVTGVCNTLLTKYQDIQCVRNCSSPDPKDRKNFEQPVIQTLQMFIGEMGCWLVVGAFALYERYVSRKAGYEPLATTTDQDDTAASPTLAGDDEDSEDSAAPVVNPLKLSEGGRVPLTGSKILLLALPACCDIAGTTLMNVGLLFVAASIYQMTRGALVLFVGLFSMLFLKRRLGAYKWFALFVVVTGVAVVGLAGAIAKDEKATPQNAVLNQDLKTVATQGFELLRREVREQVATPAAVRTIIGVLLIAGAQIFTATQFVLEENIMERYAMEPIKVVGWEGIFGFVVTVIGMIILHLAVGRTDAGRYGYFDAREGLREITHYRAIAVSSVLIMISIGGFNFFGLSVTRTVSATSRSTIDTCRTLFIWIVSLGLGWETFKWLQVVGFALLVYGTFLFNDLVRPPLKACVERRPEELLPETPIEHN
ncbi:integral membrane protein [Glonium stellatum]|uniref:Integral membrane protein n=1 Tax=Glonium stellatum TaxID=574774 RepID=A0A8E2EW83_9PEZI|nr:integral membrane protein [Glonium stellatum]